MLQLRQIPFEGTVKVEGTEEKFEIHSLTHPDDGYPVYVIDGLEEGEARMLTPDAGGWFPITIRNPISTT